LRDYETVVIWSASIPEADIEKAHDRVVEIIAEAGGSYSATEKWSRRLLAYPIKKQTEGIYHFLRWQGDKPAIEAIDKHLRIHDNCLRFITLRSEDHMPAMEDQSSAESVETNEEDEE